MRAGVEANLRLYPAYQAARNGIFWLPVFFLLFASELPLDRVLQLEALYYACVVLLEVPSGYLSDRLGRRPTLALGMAAWATAGVVFATGSGFAAFAVGQALLATGMALNSGTDSALLYDSLAALGREEEAVVHEARADRAGFASMALGSLVGGVLATGWLRLAYVASAVSGLAALLVVLRMVEPPRAETAAAPMGQLRAVSTTLGDPLLRWLTLVVVGMTVFNHVPYELVQPYLGLLVGELAPAASGMVLATTLALSAWVSGHVPDLVARLGLRPAVLGAVVVQLAIIGAMGLAVHPAVVPLVLFRGVPGAIIGPASRAAQHRRLGSGLRATFLSVQSLAGRLAFSVSLAIASAAVGDELVSAPVLTGLATGFGAAGVAFLAVLVLMRGSGDS